MVGTERLHPPQAFHVSFTNPDIRIAPLVHRCGEGSVESFANQHSGGNYETYISAVRPYARESQFVSGCNCSGIVLGNSDGEL
jgi:hypothetical protein